MLDGLRDLFLAALICDNERDAKLLINEWNNEIDRIQKIFDNYDRKEKPDGQRRSGAEIS